MLDEFGHVEILDHHSNLPGDADYTDAVVQELSRAKPSAGWNAHAFGRCDVASLQMQYDMQGWGAKYSTCLDLGDDALAGRQPNRVPKGGTTTLTATLKVADVSSLRSPGPQSRRASDCDAATTQRRCHRMDDGRDDGVLDPRPGTYRTSISLHVTRRNSAPSSPSRRTKASGRRRPRSCRSRWANDRREPLCRAPARRRWSLVLADRDGGVGWRSRWPLSLVGSRRRRQDRIASQRRAPSIQVDRRSQRLWSLAIAEPPAASLARRRRRSGRRRSSARSVGERWLGLALAARITDPRRRRRTPLHGPRRSGRARQLDGQPGDPGGHDGIGAEGIAEARRHGDLFGRRRRYLVSQVRLRFAGNLGSALYYWLIEVD